MLDLQLVEQERATLEDLGGFHWALAVLDMAAWEQLPDNLLQDVFQACLRPSILEQVGNATLAAAPRRNRMKAR